MSFSLRFFLFFLSFAMIVAVFALQPVMSAAFSDAQEKQIAEIINRHLKENPEIIIEALDSYQIMQRQKMQEQAKQKIMENNDALTGNDTNSIGPADADVTVVEFFDYNCGYCKRALADIRQIVKDDKNVRFVFKEMPILSPTSRTMARWALAASEQDKYFEYHAALMDHKGGKTDKDLKKIAKGLGLDEEKMEKDASSTKIEKTLEKHISLAREIGIQGTPAFIINGELFPGYIGPDGLVDAIEEARKAE